MILRFQLSQIESPPLGDMVIVPTDKEVCVECDLNEVFAPYVTISLQVPVQPTVPAPAYRLTSTGQRSPAPG